ncbi:MAG: DUF4172 domain-containing protein [Gammaproteobacteria bacterium]|nr:DUF4172 domain-containing protein [Gammaproteobacteria bacterium]MDE0283801.1 DUF4172 domain-containing protein [Gammaproteobacteria bacterium]MDE0512784.1 DUF4172 domain-containing protein [Gammaproteobacteria bacterium]
MNWIWEHDNWPRFAHDAMISGDLTANDFRLRSQQLHGNIEAMSAHDQLDTLADLMLSEVLNTNMIEGEKLDRDSVRASLLALLGGGSVGSVAGQDDKSSTAAEFIVDVRNHWNSPLDASLLGRWQSMIIADQPGNIIRRGAFRRDTAPMQIVSGGPGRYRVHYEAPPATRVDEEMARFLDWYNTTRPDADNSDASAGLLRAGIAHVWFEMIHPFDDGNGRVGRAIVDHAISQTLGYPALTCFSAAVLQSRKRYYRELEWIGRGNSNLDSWLRFFSETVRQALMITRQQVEFVLKKTRFFDAFGARLNERQSKMAARVFAEGIKGFEGGITTRKYQAVTKCSRATAFRDLNDMLKAGILVARPGAGRNVSYDLVSVTIAMQGLKQAGQAVILTGPQP